MEAKTKVPGSTKQTLLNKAGGVFGNVKEKVEEKAEGLLSKAKESELAERPKKNSEI